ncbi:hypothetical protein KFE96_16880 [Kordiimonas sp. SCSIO 12603]|uniref:M1 family metallopeptidase n=1 Tax=Kordiimonas sp. SCSIO 12603 TaxID=2829596 RepID=UPI002106849D|nr:M1 family aminopeptidase [Kordiimonas sp. SCSIO 12603]UTW58472.1 hypothetical protein KFE96_16880 [Kordiimonas sp. SCSIO 12603]
MPRLFSLFTALLVWISFSESNVLAAPIEPGVSLELAKERKQLLSNIHYDLTFNLKDDAEAEINSQAIITFALSSIPETLQLDFKENGEKIRQLWVNDTERSIRFEKEHLVLSGTFLNAGENSVKIEFFAGQSSLNRNDDYLYTLFVPDRARTAFPVFDQPNLKATYNLTLTMPEAWQAIANGAVKHQSIDAGVKTIAFQTSDRISSYLFSFVAGRFDVVRREHNGQIFQMLHRETDTEKLEQNVDEIFDQHYAALKWLEDYTGIKHPFQKMDFALIPAFQYGGMEHVGAIQYRASSLFLEKDASKAQELGRANLIAHEVAHMWFGNLVTMDWFNDVWTKEVFANFMAAKIVNPSFPDVNHDLNFHIRNFPRAYAVDRTEGANAIRQELPNLNEAGTLYGSIIYNKAPIMMQQLELLLGKEEFQTGIQEYLNTFAGANATWPGLISILDRRSEHDLKAWSEVWVNSPRMPYINVSGSGLEQSDPMNKGRVWPQQFTVRKLDGASKSQTVNFADANVDVVLAEGDVLLFNTDGKGYGVFPVDLGSIREHWGAFSELERASVFISAYERMLGGDKSIAPYEYYNFLSERMFQEPNQLLQGLVLTQIENIFWNFLPEKQRNKTAKELEAMLLKAVLSETNKSIQKRLFRSFQNIAISRKQLSYLYAVWEGTIEIEGLVLSEIDRIRLASTLAIKLPKFGQKIINQQYAAIQNPDRQHRFKFVAGALSPDRNIRETFFELLKQEKHRAVEAWVLSAISYLHHPLRRKHAERFIEPSIELLEDIQKTGDIFFPGRWIVATLNSHRSEEAVDMIDTFLKEHPSYNYQLKLKLLQAADQTKRAHKLTGGK